MIEPLSCYRGENGELLIMPANGRWDLIQRLIYFVVRESSELTG